MMRSKDRVYLGKQEFSVWSEIIKRIRMAEDRLQSAEKIVQEMIA
jgi:hypothetical protein